MMTGKAFGPGWGWLYSNGEGMGQPICGEGEASNFAARASTHARLLRFAPFQLSFLTFDVQRGMQTTR
jgi:hypothetical protein